MKIKIITDSKELKQFTSREDISISKVDIKSCEQSYFAQEWFVAVVMYEEKTVDNFDWKSLRAEAAKDILCAMLVDQRISEITPYKDLVKMSLECTDEFIKQLKEQ